MKYLVRVYWSNGRMGYARSINGDLIVRGTRDLAERVADQLKASDDVDLAYAVPFSDRQFQSILRLESGGVDQENTQVDLGEMKAVWPQDQDNETNDQEELIMHAFYLAVDRSDGRTVDRFTEVDQLFLAVADLGDLFDYKITTDYLQAAV